MTNKMNLLLILAGLFLAANPCLADKEEIKSPEALISRAQRQTEIWTEGTPPMQMRAELQVLGSKGDLVPGNYSFVWSSTSHWREEIRFGGYERIRVADPKGYWQKSSLEYQPESIFQLDLLLHLKETIKVGSKQTLGKIKSRKNNGVQQLCTEVKWSSGTDRTLCFDEASGSLLNVEYATAHYQNAPQISRIEYSGFNALSEKLVPYEVRALMGKKVIAAVKVVEVSPITKENSSLFTPPQNAEFWAQCDGMVEAIPVSRIQPEYPEGARGNREQGRVILYGVVEIDGTVSHLSIIQRATPALEAAAVEAVRKWRYKPPACGQLPIRKETSISVDFWLEQ